MNATKQYKEFNAEFSDMYVDSNGVLNFNRISTIRSLEISDDFYFKVKSLSNGQKIKNLLEGKDLLKMNFSSFYVLFKEFPKLFSSVGIVVKNPLVKLRIQIRLLRAGIRVPIEFVQNAKNYLSKGK